MYKHNDPGKIQESFPLNKGEIHLICKPVLLAVILE